MPTSSPTVLLVRRRAGCPHPAARNCTATHEKTLSLRGRSAPVAIRSPSAAVFMSPTAPFLSAAKEREERTPPKPRFWNPSAAEVLPVTVPSATRIGISKFRALLSYGLCAAIRWPLTRTRAALAQQRYPLCLPCYAQHFLSSFRRGRCPHRPAREMRCAAGHMGPALQSAALPEPGGQGRPPLQGCGTHSLSYRYPQKKHTPPPAAFLPGTRSVFSFSNPHKLLNTASKSVLLSSKPLTAVTMAT